MCLYRLTYFKFFTHLYQYWSNTSSIDQAVILLHKATTSKLLWIELMAINQAICLCNVVKQNTVAEIPLNLPILF